MPSATEAKPARRTGRPPLTDRTALLGAAREIGFPSLTVGAVTAKVGVKYSTFYRHFPSLDALVAALVDDTLEAAELISEPAGTWQDHIRAVCAEAHDLFSRHPGLAMAIIRLPEAPARSQQVYRQLTDLMLAAGFSPQDAAVGANAVLETVIAPWIMANERGVSLVRRRGHTADAGYDPRITAVLDEITEDPPRKWTSDAVDLLIAGLELRLAASRG